MIPEEEIKRECYKQTLDKARLLANKRSSFRSAVVNTNDIRGVRTTEISAGVVSSEKNHYYKATLLVDEGMGELIDYTCTCPAAYEYSGMCKHSAALALFYNEHPESFMGFANKRHVQSSSGDLVALMHIESKAIKAQKDDTISLIPLLRYYFGNWDLSFKISDHQSTYVLKNIDDFIERVKNKELYSYGKKLGFVHSVDCLDDQSLKLYRFIEACCEQRRSLLSVSNMPYTRDYGFGGGLHRTVRTAREISLSNTELIALFELLEGSSIVIQNDELHNQYFDISTLSGKLTSNTLAATIVREDPNLDIQIRKNENGFGITPPYEATIIESNGKLCLWRGSKIYICSDKLAQLTPLIKALYDNEGLFFTVEDAPLFCTTLLPQIVEALDIDVPEELNALKPIPVNIEFYFDANKKQITCEPYARYGKESFPLSIGEHTNAQVGAETAIRPSTKIVRDIAQETQAINLIEQFIPGGTLDIHDGELVGPLLFGGLNSFKSLGEVFTTSAFDKLLFEKTPTLSTGLTIAGNLIQLNITSDELAPEEVAALLLSYKQRKHYHRLRMGAYINIEDMDNAQLKQLSQAIEDLDISSKDLAQNKVELPTYEAFYLESILSLTTKDKTFDTYLHNFEAAKKKHYPVPTTLQNVLRAYQVEGFNWLSLLADCSFGGILADEMGLGKSVQLIAWLLSAQQHDKAYTTNLIVCPASLIYNWAAEFKKFAPVLKVSVVDGTKANRARLLSQSQNYDVLIASYDITRIDFKEFIELDLYSCILDEAQFIKNRGTKASKAVKKIQAKHRFALTGTPIENKPSELLSIFEFLMPGLLGSPMRFRENFEIPILGNDEEALNRLRALVGPFILRRTKKEVLPELPEKHESIVYTKLTSEQSRLYRANEQNLRDRLNTQKKLSAAQGAKRYAPMREDSVKRRSQKLRSKRPAIRDVSLNVSNPEDLSRVEVLAEITRLRELCLDPALVYENYQGSNAKIPVILELINQGRDAGLKMLVFSQFTSFLARIEQRLVDEKISYYKLTGSTPAKKRIEMADSFNNDDTPVFLISTKAGGTGLNLTGASFVILADPWWNAAVQDQASDRAHRLGQTRNVNVVKVVAEDTIEERIVELQETKAKLASSLIEGDDFSLASLSTDELINLLSQE